MLINTYNIIILNKKINKSHAISYSLWLKIINNFIKKKRYIFSMCNSIMLNVVENFYFWKCKFKFYINVFFFIKIYVNIYFDKISTLTEILF